MRVPVCSPAVGLASAQDEGHQHAWRWGEQGALSAARPPVHGALLGGQWYRQSRGHHGPETAALLPAPEGWGAGPFWPLCPERMAFPARR